MSTRDCSRARRDRGVHTRYGILERHNLVYDRLRGVMPREGWGATELSRGETEMPGVGRNATAGLSKAVAGGAVQWFVFMVCVCGAFAFAEERYV